VECVDQIVTVEARNQMVVSVVSNVVSVAMSVVIDVWRYVVGTMPMTMPMTMMVSVPMMMSMSVSMLVPMRLVTVMVVPVWVVTSWLVIRLFMVMMIMIVVSGFVLMIPVRHVMIVFVSLVDNVGASEEECLAVPLCASVVLWHVADGSRRALGIVRRYGRPIGPFCVESVGTFRLVTRNRLESLITMQIAVPVRRFVNGLVSRLVLVPIASRFVITSRFLVTTVMIVRSILALVITTAR
jgi:hypothetical protein